MVMPASGGTRAVRGVRIDSGGLDPPEWCALRKRSLDLVRRSRDPVSLLKQMREKAAAVLGFDLGDGEPDSVLKKEELASACKSNSSSDGAGPLFEDSVSTGDRLCEKSSTATKEYVVSAERVLASGPRSVDREGEPRQISVCTLMVVKRYEDEWPVLVLVTVMEAEGVVLMRDLGEWAWIVKSRTKIFQSADDRFRPPLLITKKSTQYSHQDDQKQYFLGAVVTKLQGREHAKMPDVLGLKLRLVKEQSKCCKVQQLAKQFEGNFKGSDGGKKHRIKKTSYPGKKATVGRKQGSAKSGYVSFWKIHKPEHYKIDVCTVTNDPIFVGVLQTHNSGVCAMSWEVSCTRSLKSSLLLATGCSDVTTQEVSFGSADIFMDAVDSVLGKRQVEGLYDMAEGNDEDKVMVMYVDTPAGDQKRGMMARATVNTQYQQQYVVELSAEEDVSSKERVAPRQEQ